MLTHVIEYEDFNGNPTKEVFYFHLSKAELLDIELGFEGGLEAGIKKIIETENHAELVKIFKKILVLSYGIKSDDGKRFMKSDSLREEFTQTAAFDELFIQLTTDEAFAATFIQGILPKDIQEAATKAIAKQSPPIPQKDPGL